MLLFVVCVCVLWFVVYLFCLVAYCCFISSARIILLLCIYYVRLVVLFVVYGRIHVMCDM